MLNWKLFKNNWMGAKLYYPLDYHNQTQGFKAKPFQMKLKMFLWGPWEQTQKTNQRNLITPSHCHPMLLLGTK